MEYKESDLVNAISLSFKSYKVHGARSTEKLKPLHLFLARTIEQIWGDGFEVHFLGDGTKEQIVDGRYYPKAIDVTITDNGKPIFCLGLKFVTSNYKQNANNYFENMLGETANIQAVDGLPYAQLIILRRETPYYEKEGNLKKIEIINEKDLQKYVNLMLDVSQAHRPLATGVFFVDIDEANCLVKSVNVSEFFNDSCATVLKTTLSVQNLFHEVENFRNLYLMKENL